MLFYGIYLKRYKVTNFGLNIAQITVFNIKYEIYELACIISSFHTI